MTDKRNKHNKPLKTKPDNSLSSFMGFLLIPIIAVGIWCYYYSIDRGSTIALFKLLAPVYIGLYVIFELIFRLFIPRIANSFKLGFWIGVFILAPFYMYQMSFHASFILRQVPENYLFYVYLLIGLISALALGLLFKTAFDLLINVKHASNPGTAALLKLTTILLCMFILLPTFSKNRAAQSQLAKKRTSYRAVVQRDPIEKPLHRMIVLGIDGGDWQVIEPLIEDGKLPHFKKLLDEGRWGVLESMKPYRSPVLWTTIFTGQTPKKHGIEDWEIAYSKNRLVKAVWNIFSEYELRSTIINIPATFPPEEFIGKGISGFPCPNQTMNMQGWMIRSKPMKNTLTPFKLLDLKLDADGNYWGKLTVTDVLIDKYNAGMRGKVFKNIWIQAQLQTKLAEIYGMKIDVARFKYFKDEGRFDILLLHGDGAPLATLEEGKWSDYLTVQLEPGVVGVTKIKAVKLDGDDLLLYMTPFFMRSENPKHPFTFPTALSKDITKLFGQYVVEMTWMAAKDIILLPAIKELLISTESKKSVVGKALFDENEWDLFIQVFTLTDRLQHPTWAFRYGEYSDTQLKNLENAEMIQKIGYDAIAEGYDLADEWIGDILEGVDPENDVILIASDHGFKAGSGLEVNLGIHRGDGIYVAWGGPIEPVSRGDYKSNKSENKSVKDITRNMLYLTGLPVGEDMAGEIWLDFINPDFLDSHPVTTIPTYNSAEETRGTQQKIDPSALEQLKGLGYIDGGNIEGN